eukprot:gene4924-6890_t
MDDHDDVVRQFSNLKINNNDGDASSQNSSNASLHGAQQNHYQQQYQQQQIYPHHYNPSQHMGDDQYTDHDIGKPNSSSSSEQQQRLQQDFSSDSSSTNCNLIVNYLPHTIDDNDLREMFLEWGEVVMTKVVRDKNTKKSLGYGFVKFLNERDALLAIEKMNGLSIESKILKVSVARPPSLEIRNCKLYITNLPREYSERDVVALFGQFGEIIECRVLQDKNTRNMKGVAFVQYNLKAQADNALALNGYAIDGTARGLVVKYAEDQHKKKELNRLHSLTTSAFRDGSGSNDMIDPHNRHRMGGQKQDMQGYFYGPSHRDVGSMYPGQVPLIQQQSRQPQYMQQPDYSSRGLYNKNRKGPDDRAMGPNSMGMGQESQPNPQWGYTNIAMHPVGMGIMSGYAQPPTIHDPHSPVSLPMHTGQYRMNMLNSIPMLPTSNMPPQVPQNFIRKPVTQGIKQAPQYNDMQQHFNRQQQPQQPPPQQLTTCIIIVSNISTSIDKQSLIQLFSNFGQVMNLQFDSESVKPHPFKPQESLIKAKIKMEITQAEYACASLNGVIILEGSLPLQVTISPSSIR